MKNIIKSTILTFILMSIIALPVYATTSANTIAELRQELSSLKAQKTANENKKNQTAEQIADARSTILTLQQDIETGKKQIEQAKADIEALTQEIADTQDSIKDLMNSYQIANGDNVYLDYLFNATSYADLVYRYSLVQQVVSFNDEQITSWESKVEYNNQLQKELAQKETELNNEIAEMEEKEDELGDQLDELDDISISVDDQITSTQELINTYVKMGCGENEDLNQCATVLADTGFRKPLTKGTITSYYGWRTNPLTGATTGFHYGTDIGGNKEGTSVYSIAAGRVSSIVRESSCGGNMVFIYHLVNGVKYTSVYMHLLSIKVGVGDAVTTNTVIGTVGGGAGTSSYETCSTGAHLHLGLAIGWYTIANYTKFKANSVSAAASKYLNLPSKGVYWFSR